MSKLLLMLSTWPGSALLVELRLLDNSAANEALSLCVRSRSPKKFARSAPFSQSNFLVRLTVQLKHNHGLRGNSRREAPETPADFKHTRTGTDRLYGEGVTISD